KAVRLAVMINPANVPTYEVNLQEIPEAARAIGLQIQVLNASTSPEIEAAFATIVRDRADALFVAADAFFATRNVQIATLAARHGIPASYSTRAYTDVGGLMSYGASATDAATALMRRVRRFCASDCGAGKCWRSSAEFHAVWLGW